MAAEAGELLLRVGAPLPKLEERALTKKDHRFYKTADAMYSENTNTVTFNKPRVKDVHKFYGSYKNYEESQVKDGWLSQPNMFLHELGHYLDHYFGKEQPDNRIGDLFSRLDEKKVEADVSGYAATSKAEFMAELYSGILSGKVYPEEYLKAANLDYYTKVEIAQQLLSMASGEVPNTTALQQQWGDMIHAVYTEGGASFKIELLANPEVEKFIDTHAQVLDNTFALTDMSDVMRERLQKSDYIFSGIKTFHELHEVFPSLLDEDGKRKPFEQFLSDVQKVDNTYNRNYLNAEYNFAQASSEMAGKWEDFVEDGDDYLLQYRTQQDSKVRPEHAELHGITLPVTDSFWDEYFPPNGWNCRCTVVQVLKGKNVPTDHDEAMSRGKVAVAKDTKGMFRFNPGKEMRTFPAYNAYTISKCATCDKAKLNLAKEQNELCAWCSDCLDNAESKMGVEPPHVEDYTPIHGGKVMVSPYHGEEELEENKDMGTRLAELLGKTIYLLPRLNSNTEEERRFRQEYMPEGAPKTKNPDFFDKAKFYDGKNLYGFSGGNDEKKQKQAISNHIKKAKGQAGNYVFDLPDVFNMGYVSGAIRGYLNCSKSPHTIVVFHKGKGYIYEK